MDAAERARKCAEDIYPGDSMLARAHRTEMAPGIQRHLEEHAAEAVADHERSWFPVLEAAHALADRLAAALGRLVERVDHNGGIGEYRGGPPFVMKDAREALAAHAEARKEEPRG